MIAQSTQWMNAASPSSMQKRVMIFSSVKMNLLLMSSLTYSAWHILHDTRNVKTALHPHLGSSSTSATPWYVPGSWGSDSTNAGTRCNWSSNPCHLCEVENFAFVWFIAKRQPKMPTNLPLPDEVQNQLIGATIFTSLNLQCGYWQLPVSAEDRAFCLNSAVCRSV